MSTAAERIKVAVSKEVESIGKKAVSRGHRAVQKIRNAELNVLKGSRSGKMYGKHRASAHGEAPAVKSGDLRGKWRGVVEGNISGSGATVIPTLESEVKYAGYLQDGTMNMEPRPYVEKIKEKALPEVKRIFQEPF